MVEVAFEEPENVDNLSVTQLKDLKVKNSRDVLELLVWFKEELIILF